MHRTIGFASLLMLTACMTVDGQTAASQSQYVNQTNETQRAINLPFQDLPFDSGKVYVVASEHGEMQTYSLTPCHGGTRICGGAGGVGQIQRTVDYFVVTGAYRDRTFYLSPGGDGYLTWRGETRNLAWN